MITNKEQADLAQRTKHYRKQFQPDVEGALARLHERMDSATVVANTVTVRKSRRIWLKVAAAALVLVAALLYLNFNDFGGQVYATTNNIQEITLPDGTKVILNQYSELRYRSSYNDSERAVKLVGEAFFSVVPDASRPFMVRQGNTELKVVGTSFNLQTAPISGLFEVEVATGKVALSAEESSVYVVAKQCGRFLPGEGLHTMEAPHLNRQAWRTKELTFEAVPLSTVIKSVSKAYGVKIYMEEVDRAACDFELTASYSNAPLVDVLADLERWTGGKFSKDANAEVYQMKGWCKAN